MDSKKIHTEYFQVAGISIEVKSDLPIKSTTFASKFGFFAIPGPLEENVVLHHHFLSESEDIKIDQSNKLYFRPPWAIYKQGEKWIYQWIKTKPPYKNYYQTVVTDRKHNHLDVYNDEVMKHKFLNGGLDSLTMFPTDQILIGRLLAYRNGCIMHSLGIILDDNGYLFVGHSDAGKSTMALMMKKEALVLCDDRNVIRKTKGTYRLSGTWSHGDILDVSSKTAPLKGIFFLKQSDINKLEPIEDEMKIFESLLACLIRPLETRDWWEKSLDFLTMISAEVPCWNLKFNKNGKVLDVIKSL